MTSAPIAGKDDVRVTEEDRETVRAVLADTWVIGRENEQSFAGDLFRRAERCAALARTKAERRAYERCAEIADEVEAEVRSAIIAGMAMVPVDATAAMSAMTMTSDRIRALLNSTKG